MDLGLHLSQFSAVLIGLVLLALAFDFMNGFHDAANAIATIVSTGVLKPWQAVIWAALFNFVAIRIFSVTVAATVGKGIVQPDIVDQHVVFGALTGALTWNIITWYWGIPSSSSHALIGGMIGAAVAKAGTAPLIAAGIKKTAIFLVISPLVGLMLSSCLVLLFSWLCFRRSPSTVDRWFRRIQLLSCAAFSVGHGGNDAQKTMGVIWVLLISAGITTREHMPTWVIVACYTAIALGTLFGGWRIVKTMGQRITKLRPVGGVSADLAAATTLWTATAFGIPVSTTHAVTGAILGVGAATRANGVNWAVFGDIVLAWVLTIPCSAFVAGLAWWISWRLF
jgi:inorganic phosphate transporter, PiT family